MTPPELAKSNTEHAHQRALFAWAQIARRYGFAAADDPLCYTQAGYVQQTYGINPRHEPNPSGRGKRWADDGGYDAVPELEWLHAIPNGGRRDGFTAALMKAEGAKKGICDVYLPLPMKALRIPPFEVSYRLAGLYIEMKRPKVGKQRQGATSEVQDEFIAYARRVGYAVAVCFDWLSASRQVMEYIEECRKAA